LTYLYALNFQRIRKRSEVYYPRERFVKTKAREIEAGSVESCAI
jgi:hypothetical protein